MKRICVVLLACSLSAPLAAGEMGDRAQQLTRTEMQSVLQLLGHDLFEGRAPGTRGGDLAELYSRSMFQWMNLVPGWRGDYFQPFVMQAFTTRDLTVSGGGRTLRYLEDVVGNSVRPTEEFRLEGDAVFVGFGIHTDLWEWDDFKGTDLRDKIVIVRVNDPGSVDPGLFEGRMMTYFGRWRYKIEEAERQGARAILIIHTDASAGYGWHVVQNSWSGEQLYLPASLENDLAFRGWIREASLRELLTDAGVDLDQLYAASMEKGFRPVPLPLRLQIEGRTAHREIAARNVVAEIPGRTDRRLVLVAHIDHLGTNPALEGDQIFNGAIDNGSAVTAMLLTARVLNEFRSRLEHTITLLACQAEEEGLLGSMEYAMHADRTKIDAVINFESSPVWEESDSLFGVGARFSTLEDLLVEIAKEEGVAYEEFSMSDQGFFYRSDQYPFATHGIPAIWISAGERFRSGTNHLRDFFTGDYHTPRDEFDPAWDLGALRQTIKYAVRLVEKLDRAPEPPRWKIRLTFPTVE